MGPKNTTKTVPHHSYKQYSMCVFFLPGVYLDSEEPQHPSLRAEPSQPEEEELGFWLVRPGGGLEGAATDRALGGRGTFHSSWAREELDAEPPPGDHFDSLGLAARRNRGTLLHLVFSWIFIYLFLLERCNR